MIQSIYTSVTNANIIPCGKKGLVISSDPIPLLRNKYLGEYRTELEKAKVRRNLGIKDDLKIAWGLLEGTIEELKDLISYVETKWHYDTDLDIDIHTVSQALDYIIVYIKSFKSEAEDIDKLFNDAELIRQLLNTLLESLKSDIKVNTVAIENIQSDITKINNAIETLNLKLLTINVDKNILEWMKHAVKDSNSMHLTEDNKLDVTISNNSTNAIKVLEGTPEISDESGVVTPAVTPGIYVKDVSENVTNLENTVATHDTSINQITTELETVDTYNTILSDETVSPDKIGGIELGTSVAKLKGKKITEILDYILFPTYIRDLIYPSASYSSYNTLVEIKSTKQIPTLIFNLGDAGVETSREEKVMFMGQPVEIAIYDLLGTYTHIGSISYNAGEYLIDNKGQVSDKRIEAGTVETLFSVTTTYPWYAGNTISTNKQSLVEFNQTHEEILPLGGLTVIKLPGSNTILQSFKVDAGMGYLDVDLKGWSESTESLGGFTYKVWKKNEEYPRPYNHKIQFKLVE